MSLQRQNHIKKLIITSQWSNIQQQSAISVEVSYTTYRYRQNQFKILWYQRGY